MKREQIINIFSTLISHQSISTVTEKGSELKKTALYIKKLFEDLGCSVQIFKKQQAHPMVLVSLNFSPKAKTIGIYAHYDVQPEDPVDEWQSEPFKLTERSGKLYGRGVADDKGHIVQIYSALAQCLAQKQLNYNIICLFEGEEEVGSTHFEKYVSSISSKLSTVDAFYVLDAGLFRKNVPAIFYGLRGLASFELTVRTAGRDLHSGSYGNKVLNPAHILADIVQKLKDSRTNKVLIPGFYDKVRKINAEEKRLLSKIERSDTEEMKEASVKALTSIDNISSTLISKIYPSLDINGLYSGYTGPGIKTIIPSSATVKFTCRLVENQRSKEVQKIVLDYVRALIPIGVDYDLKSEEAIEPFYCALDDKYMKRTSEVLSAVFGNETLFNRSGGSIPAAEILQRNFGKPVIVTGFTMPDSRLHSPNENIDEEMFFKGIEALTNLISS